MPFYFSFVKNNKVEPYTKKKSLAIFKTKKQMVRHNDLSKWLGIGALLTHLHLSSEERERKMSKKSEKGEEKINK